VSAMKALTLFQARSTTNGSVTFPIFEKSGDVNSEVVSWALEWIESPKGPEWFEDVKISFLARDMQPLGSVLMSHEDAIKIGKALTGGMP
jgi:hypothetical protein